MNHALFRLLVSCLVTFALLAPVGTPLKAQPVSTAEALALEPGNETMAVIDAWFAREDVVRELEALGVDPSLAHARVASLSPAELEAMATRMEEMPAGATGALTVLGIVFLVLLVLHVTGVLKIFRN